MKDKESDLVNAAEIAAFNIWGAVFSALSGEIDPDRDDLHLSFDQLPRNKAARKQVLIELQEKYASYEITLDEFISGIDIFETGENLQWDINRYTKEYAPLIRIYVELIKPDAINAAGTTGVRYSVNQAYEHSKDNLPEILNRVVAKARCLRDLPKRIENIIYPELKCDPATLLTPIKDILMDVFKDVKHYSGNKSFCDRSIV